MKRLKYMLPVILGFFISLSIYLNINEISIANIVLDFSFASAEYYMAYITEITYWYVPILMSHFLFGTSIYKHFCSASVYYFSRTSKRKRWYCIESLKLYADIIIYLVLLLGSSVCPPLMSGKLQDISATDILLLLYYLAIYSIYIFITAELINIISIFSSSNIGFAIMELLCLTSFGLYSVTGELFSENFIMKHTGIIRFNPACHLMIDIHSSQLEYINVLINKKNIDFQLRESLISLGIAAVAVVIIGSFIIQNTDIIKQKPEGQ